MNYVDQSPDYWLEYSNLQHVKHAIIRNYLNGWFPKLALGQWGSGRILYLDTHAGRGQHLNGQLGSPLVALSTLIEHRSRKQLLAGTEVNFIFLERDEENLECLQDELTNFGALPKNVGISCASGDAFKLIEDALDSLSTGKSLAPAFIFVDPYGFKIPGQLLKRLMKFRRVELFINVIWRELDMAIQQGENMPDGMKTTLDSIFDGDGWREIDSDDFDVRAEECVNQFRAMTEATWATSVRMLGNNGKTRYMLLHLSNHDAGRDLMKECIWFACPNGGYYARKTDNPNQQMLISLEPDLRPLQDWVIDKLSIRPTRWQQLAESLRNELWLNKHLNEIIRKMRKSGVIVASDYEGRFAFKNDPLLSLPIT